jgi:type I restriction enzyme S subunit
MNWSIKKLGDVLEKIVGGGTPSMSNPDYWGGNISWASVKDIKENSFVLTQTEDYITEEGMENSATNLIPSGSLIMATRMGLGRVVKTKIDTTINQDLKALFPGNDLDSDYLLFFLKSKSQELINKGSGATVSGIKLEHIKDLEIPLPPLPEQKRLVKKIEELFAKIDEAKKLREEAIKETESLIPSTLHRIFTAGQAKGWPEKEIGEIAPIRRKNNKDLLPYVGMEDVESGTGIFLGSFDSKKVSSNTFYFDQDCVLYGRLRPYLNKVLIPNFKGHCSTEMFPLVPDTTILSREYLWYWLTQKSFIDAAMKTAMGSRMPRAKMTEVVKFKILIPPISEQKKIVAELDSLSAKVKQLKELQKSTSADLTALKQSILHKAFSGEL